MILTNRLFERNPPSRDAKSIYIFCEGAKREYQYFKYFRQLDSRINIEIYKLHPKEDNSPLGLLNIAKKCIFGNREDESPNPKYNFTVGDEVWIVLDIDKDKGESRQPQIEQLQDFCSKNKDWNLVRSNPCFEVWLYYHIHADKPEFDCSDKCIKWKGLVNSSIDGGFDSRRHPIFIEKATKNAKYNYSKSDILNTGSTEVFQLADSIIPLLKSKLSRVLKEV